MAVSEVPGLQGHKFSVETMYLRGELRRPWGPGLWPPFVGGHTELSSSTLMTSKLLKVEGRAATAAIQTSWSGRLL